jgi:hypothetical protein
MILIISYSSIDLQITQSIIHFFSNIQFAQNVDMQKLVNSFQVSFTHFGCKGLLDTHS